MEIYTHWKHYNTYMYIIKSLLPVDKPKFFLFLIKNKKTIQVFKLAHFLESSCEKYSKVFTTI